MFCAAKGALETGLSLFHYQCPSSVEGTCLLSLRTYLGITKEFFKLISNFLIILLSLNKFIIK